MTTPSATSFQPAGPASPGTILRSAFFRLSPADQRRCLAERCKVVDDPATPKPSVITQAAFDRMPAVGQALYTDRGGRVSE